MFWALWKSTGEKNVDQLCDDQRWKQIFGVDRKKFDEIVVSIVEFLSKSNEVSSTKSSEQLVRSIEFNEQRRRFDSTFVQQKRVDAKLDESTVVVLHSRFAATKRTRKRISFRQKSTDFVVQQIETRLVVSSSSQTKTIDRLDARTQRTSVQSQRKLETTISFSQLVDEQRKNDWRHSESFRSRLVRFSSRNRCSSRNSNRFNAFRSDFDRSRPRNSFKFVELQKLSSDHVRNASFLYDSVAQGVFRHFHSNKSFRFLSAKINRRIYPRKCSNEPFSLFAFSIEQIRSQQIDFDRLRSQRSEHALVASKFLFQIRSARIFPLGQGSLNISRPITID